MFAFLLAALTLRAQQDEPPTPEVTHEMAPADTPPPDPSILVTVHGIVRNTATGEPLPRALVQVGGASGQAALTDGDGRFEIGGVPPGPNVFQLTRPGFRDTVPNVDRSMLAIVEPVTTHSVFVLAGMPTLSFAMKPANVIRGQVELSTGESAQGIQVTLLRRGVQDGRGFWHSVANTRTNSDGQYRFGGLDDGEYAVYTDPSMEGEIPAEFIQPGSDEKFARNGFACTYYPDARDFASAGRITVRNGDTIQANIRLALEPFHLVRAEVVRSSARNAAAEAAVQTSINDAHGNRLPYNAFYDAGTHSIQALLPDGAYTLRVFFAATGSITLGGVTSQRKGPPPEAGQISVSVQSRNLTRLRIPIAPEQASSIQGDLQRTAAQTQPIPQSMRRVDVMLNQAGEGNTGEMVAQFADGQVPGTLQSTPASPGAYWAHLTTGPNLCESSFTAGGASLGREPLVVNASGATAPLTLTLRDDCAQLRLVMPSNLLQAGPGEEPTLYVFIVPDFDSTTGAAEMRLRPSLGGSAIAQNLTPGSYHVYTFPAQVAFEYHNREVLASSPSQQVTLEPGATATLTLEAPAQ